MSIRKSVIAAPVVVVAILGYLAAHRPVPAAHAAGNPPIYLSVPKVQQTLFQGEDATVRLLNSGQATPLSMASGDFDADGVSDLATGYATAAGGRVAIFRGNLDAFAPQSQQSFEGIGRGEFPAPFQSGAQVLSVPGQPDFLATGVFIGHNGTALLTASRGGKTISVLGRNSAGSFEVQQTIATPGAITALAAQTVNQGPFSQVVVGVHGDSGPALITFAGSNDGLVPSGSFPLTADATAFAFGNLDGDSHPDVLAIAGGQLTILHGGSQSLQSVSVPYTAVAAALGNFVSDRQSFSQIALLSNDGTVHILVRDGIDSRPFAVQEMRARRLTQLARRPSRVPTPASAEQRLTWKETENFPGAASFDAGGLAPQFFKTRIADNGADDLMLLGGGRLTVIAHSGPNPTTGVVINRPESVNSVIAAQSLRVNIDGRPGVVFLRQDGVAPFAMMPLPDPTYFVNRFDDPAPGAVASTCNNVSSGDTSTSCSLREAVRKANANTGTDTILLVAGTYTLAQPKIPNDFSSTGGTLDVTDSVNIVGTVDGSGNPTSIVQAGNTSTNGVDKIFSFNQDIDAFTTATVSISNLVLKFGHNNGDMFVFDGWGGAFDFDTGGSDSSTATATLSVTNCNITNNQTTSGEGGGFTIFNTNGGTGFATITNSIVQNNTAHTDPGVPGNGGGIMVADPAALTMNNTQVLNNTATANAGGFGVGGGLYVIGGGGGSNGATIHGGSISGNNSAADGGGIWSTGSLTIDQGTTFSGNTAAGGGGGIFFDGEPGDNLSVSKVTIIGNHATGSAPTIASGKGGGIYAAQPSTALSFDVHFSRIAGNTTTSSGTQFFNEGSTGTVSITNNWWGTNTPAITAIVAGSPAATFDPFIVLTHTASPNKIKINQTSTLTADMSKDNHGNGAALAGNLDALNGVPVTFNNAVNGTITSPQPTIQSNGMATATFNAGATPGAGSADATVDQQTVTATLTILAPPTMSKAFSPAMVTVGTTSTLTFSLSNPNTVTIDSSFTDTLPSGLVVATPANVVNTCGGTVTATAGSGVISFANAAFAVGSCTIKVDVKSAVDNVYNNSVTLQSSDAGPAATAATATLTVINPPAIAKAFGAATLSLNGTTSLTFTISTTNTNLTMTGLAFTDSLPAGLVVATPGNPSSTCSGATVTAANGSSSVALSGASLAPGPACTVTVTVQGTTGGVKNNSVQITSANAGTGNTATASITVVGPPTISKAFGAASIPLGTTTSLSFTITNPNSTGPLTGVSFSDTLPAGLTITDSSSAQCGGTLTTVAATGVISLSNATVANGSPCVINLTVTGATAGTWNNTTGAVTSNEGGPGSTSNTATISVVAPPTISKSFGAAFIPLSGTTTVTFTITNPAANTQGQTGVAFTDTLPAGLTVASTPGVVNTCAGTVLAVANSGSISFSGGALAINSNCSITVNVTGTTSGVKNNTTGAISSTNGGTGATSNTASLTVASPPTISKAFGASQIALNGTTSVTFTITNPNSGVALSGIAFSDALPAGLVVATPNGVVNTCSGTVTAVAASSSVSLSAGTIPSSSSCTLTVNVTGTTAGVKNNTTGAVSSTEAGAGAPSNTATLTVVAPPTIAKAFTASSVPLNGSTTVTFTITNPNAVGLTGVAFSDALPAGLVVATPNGVVNTCSGTATAVAASSAITLSAGTIPASSSCTLSVNVTGTTAGTKNNTTGAVSSTEGGTGAVSNTATLTVVAPPTISKAFGASNIPLNGTTTVTFTLTNPAANTVAQTGVAFTDALPAGLTVATTPGVVNTCSGTVTAVANSGSISLSGGSIAIASSCSITVNVTGTTAGVKNNTTGAVSSTNGGTGATSNTATVTVASPPTISKAFGASSILLNGTTSLTFTLTNPNSGFALTGVAFTDALPSGLQVATPNGLSSSCGGTTTAVAGSGSVSLSGGNLASSGTCTISLNVKGVAAGSQNNTTGAVSSTETGPGAPSNTATVTVVGPPSITKNFGATSVDILHSTSLTFTVTNPNSTLALTGVAFHDTLPLGLLISFPNGLTGSCGGGTITALPLTNTISLSGATLATGATCTFSVNVTGIVFGHWVNTTSNVTSTNGGTGNQATDTLDVGLPDLTIAKSHVGNFVRGQSGANYTITVSNSGFAATSGTVTVTDTLPPGPNTLVPTAISGSGWSCVLATLTCTRSDALAGGSSYPVITLTVNVPQNILPVVTNTARVSGGGDGEPLNNTAFDVTVITSH